MLCQTPQLQSRPAPVTSQSCACRNRPRVGIIDLSLSPSGISRYVDSLCAGINPDEFDLTIFCRRTGPHRNVIDASLVFCDSPSQETTAAMAGEPPRKSAARHVARSAWRSFTPPALRRWSGFLREARALRDIFAAHPVDLLHAQMINTDESVVAARMANIPRIVGTMHIDSSRCSLGDWPMELASAHSVHRLIAVSENIRKDWKRRTFLSDASTTTIFNGVDVADAVQDRDTARRALGLPSDALIVGGVGRLAEQKGFATLLRAAAALLPANPTLAIAIAGEGPLRQSLLALAEELKISERLFLLGQQSDIHPVYAAIDILALPSLWEALPFTVLEAMAAGLPVVASDIAGIPEVVEQNITGFLIPPGDSRAFAAALQPLLGSPKLRSALGDAGRQRIVAHFTLRDMVQQTTNIYREFLARQNKD
jgi:glycosyltransferase involved in cell wall biosynthesis